MAFSLLTAVLAGFIGWRYFRPQILTSQRQKTRDEVVNKIAPMGKSVNENIPAVNQANLELATLENELSQTKTPSALLLRNVADRYYLTGQLGKAIDTYLREVKINANDGVLYGKLGDAYKEDLAYEKAVDAYNKSILLLPKGNLSYYGLADIYQYNFNQIEKAKGVYQNLLIYEPDNTVAIEALSRLP